MAVCRFCKDRNFEEIDNKCISCGCPLYFEPGDKSRWNEKKGYFEPRKPSVMVGKVKFKDGIDLNCESVDTLVHCSNCRLLMYLGERECPHCNYVYTTNEVRQLQYNHDEQYKSGVVHGVIFFIILLVAFLYLSFKATSA